MYLVATFALFYSIGRLRRLSPALLFSGYVAANAVLAILLYWVPVARRVIFALLLIAVIARASATKYLRIAVGIMGIAFVIWILDFTRVVCRPDSWIQGHAIWHILGAVAAWYLFLNFDELERNRHGNAASR
jgi:hypothetical protein